MLYLCEVIWDGQQVHYVFLSDAIIFFVEMSKLKFTNIGQQQLKN